MARPDPIISRIEEERVLLGWSRGGLDRRAGMPRGTWARVRRVQSATFGTVARYAATLGYELGLVARGQVPR